MVAKSILQQLYFSWLIKKLILQSLFRQNSFGSVQSLLIHRLQDQACTRQHFELWINTLPRQCRRCKTLQEQRKEALIYLEEEGPCSQSLLVTLALRRAGEVGSGTGVTQILCLCLSPTRPEYLHVWFRGVDVSHRCTTPYQISQGYLFISGLSSYRQGGCPKPDLGT